MAESQPDLGGAPEQRRKWCHTRSSKVNGLRVVPTGAGSSRLHLASTVEDVGGAASGRRASGVRAVVVVVVQVALDSASDAGEADLAKAGEDRAPAFLEDRAVQAFDVAVDLRPSG